MSEKATFNSLCIVLDKISATQKRTEINCILLNFFRELQTEELIFTCYLMTPSNFDFGIGENIIIKIMATVCNTKTTVIKNNLKQLGDLGLVAQKLKLKGLIKTVSININELFSHLKDLEQESGKSSIQSKSNKMTKMITRCSKLEVKYLIRIYEGKLKIGVSVQSILISLALTFKNIENGYILEKTNGLTNSEIFKKKKTQMLTYQPAFSSLEDGIQSQNQNDDTKQHKSPTHEPIESDSETKRIQNTYNKPEEILLPNEDTNKIQDQTISKEELVDKEQNSVKNEKYKLSKGTDNNNLISNKEACVDIQAKGDAEIGKEVLSIKIANDSKIKASQKASIFTMSQIYAKPLVKNEKCLQITLENYIKEAEQEKSVIQNVKYAYNMCPSFDFLIKTLSQYGPDDILNHVSIQPLIPIKPMLAQATKNLTNAFLKINEADVICEYKYDGERAQIHKNGDKYKIYSRNLEDITGKYPELKTIVFQQQDNFIIDCEVVAYNKEESKILPFQYLSTRKRKDVEIENIQVPVCLFVFDILFYKNESLLECNLRDRKKILKDILVEEKGVMEHVNSKDCSTSEEIDLFFNASLKENCEGLMIKDSNSLYKPSLRCTNWIKLKKDYLEGLADSFDLVVVGAYYGKGKRTNKLGGFLMACYDDKNDVYETMCKLGTGFDDQTLDRVSEDLLKNTTSKLDYVISGDIKPDIWITPKNVWEIKAAGMSVSPVYFAAHKINEEGISLRFPRFIRIREDKHPTDATSSKQIYFMYDESKNEAESEDEFN